MKLPKKREFTGVDGRNYIITDNSQVKCVQSGKMIVIVDNNYAMTGLRGELKSHWLPVMMILKNKKLNRYYNKFKEEFDTFNRKRLLMYSDIVRVNVGQCVTLCKCPDLINEIVFAIDPYEQKKIWDQYAIFDEMFYVY
tara:strand:+ start:475 stop:891 length:417 start_codon:yes stop_codon:yes gene_type:complete